MLAATEARPRSNWKTSESLWVPLAVACQMLACSRNTLRRRISNGKIPREFVYQPQPNILYLWMPYCRWPSRIKELQDLAKQDWEKTVDLIQLAAGATGTN